MDETKTEVLPPPAPGQQVVQTQQPGQVTPVEIYNFPTQDQINEYGQFLKNYDTFVMANLKDGTDYGMIPGVKKPSLFKPGAEKLEKLFFLTHEKVQVEKIIDKDFIKYTYKTLVFDKTGRLKATCEGCCNSEEKKYQGKPLADVDNTLMKMAQKRSYVGAMLEATGSSARFTQDVEDMDRSQFQNNNRNQGGYDDRQPAQRRAYTPAAAPAKPVQKEMGAKEYIMVLLGQCNYGPELLKTKDDIAAAIMSEVDIALTGEPANLKDIVAALKIRIAERKGGGGGTKGRQPETAATATQGPAGEAIEGTVVSSREYANSPRKLTVLRSMIDQKLGVSAPTDQNYFKAISAFYGGRMRQLTNGEVTRLEELTMGELDFLLNDLMKMKTNV